MQTGLVTFPTVKKFPGLEPRLVECPDLFLALGSAPRPHTASPGQQGRQGLHAAPPARLRSPCAGDA